MGPDPTGHTHLCPPSDAGSGTNCSGVEQYGRTGSSSAGLTPSARHCQLLPPTAAVSGSSIKGTEQYGNASGTGVMNGGSSDCGQSATPGKDPGAPELQTGVPPGSDPATVGQQRATAQNTGTHNSVENLVTMATPSGRRH